MRSNGTQTTLQFYKMALMKLIATPEELKKLSMQFVESDNNTKLNIETVTKEQLKMIDEQLRI